MRLLLVRHGESSWNVEGRWQGHDGTGLTDRGRRQAEAAGAWIVARYPDVRLLARSDLQRVAESATPLQARLEVPLVVDERLRELDIGTWAGLTHGEVAARDPEGFAAWQRGEDTVIGGAERIGDLRRRVRAAIADVVASARGEGGGTAVVVTHGGCVRAAAATLLDHGGWAWQELGGVANASVTEFAFEGPQARLVRWASTAHLDATLDAAPAGTL